MRGDVADDLFMCLGFLSTGKDTFVSERREIRRWKGPSLGWKKGPCHDEDASLGIKLKKVVNEVQ